MNIKINIIIKVLKALIPKIASHTPEPFYVYLLVLHRTRLDELQTLSPGDYPSILGNFW